MYFAKIQPVSNLYDTVMIDDEHEKLYVQTHFLDLPEAIPNEVLVDKGVNEEIYGIDSTAECCMLGTWKYAICYSHERELSGLNFSDCTVMEYFSDTLVKLMCKYLNNEEERDSMIDFSFQVEDVQIRFCGHRVYINQQNPDYESYDPAVIVTFPSEKTTRDKIRYIHAIDDMLRLVFFQQNISKPQVKFTRTDLQKENYIVFNINDPQRYVSDNSSNCWNQYTNRFEEIKEDMPVIMTYLLSHDINAEYFKHYYMAEDFQMQKLFSDTYFVFDKLANKAYGKAEELNPDFEAFKKKAWEILEQSAEYEKVKDHVGNLKDKIMSHGRERGHKEKLRKAMEEIAKLIPERNCFYNFYNEESIKNIYRLRTNIVHNGTFLRFDNEERMAGEKLQWLTYALQLKQIGIPDNRMEEWLNSAFGVG